MGGNSIQASGGSDDEWKSEMAAFFDLLRDDIPGTLRVAVQIEQRFYSVPNRFNAPGEEEYKKIRNRRNHLLHSFKGKHYLCMIGGPARMDDKSLYASDGVHLTHGGISKYFNITGNFIQYVYLEMQK